MYFHSPVSDFYVINIKVLITNEVSWLMLIINLKKYSYLGDAPLTMLASLLVHLF